MLKTRQFPRMRLRSQSYNFPLHFLSSDKQISQIVNAIQGTGKDPDGFSSPLFTGVMTFVMIIYYDESVTHHVDESHQCQHGF
ncbi:hypothetical protein V6N13_053236 [Hibiscus sabdariffa]